jgi:DNA-binding Lrp family transcriptional regulator
MELAKCQTAQQMDNTDRRLVSLLRDNARLPVTSLAAILGVSRATVQNRIDRLVRDGAITGFTIKLRPDAEPAAI